jgi:putative flippase GtrA
VKAAVNLFASRQFLTFLLVGGSAALANFLTGAAIRHYQTTDAVYLASIVAGFVVGTVLSFVLNRRFTFNVAHEPMGPQLVRFGVISLGAVLVGLAAAAAVLGAWKAFGRSLINETQAESLGHVGAIGFSTIYNFLAMKFFAFAE